MKPIHIQAFEIGGVRFHLTDRGDGSLQVASIHPYDETEYHWAYEASKSVWHIVREGKRVAVFQDENGECVRSEAVARFLLKLDAEAHLKPIRAIW